MIWRMILLDVCVLFLHFKELDLVFRHAVELDSTGNLHWYNSLLILLYFQITVNCNRVICQNFHVNNLAP